jgi:hypothetical protein
VGFAGVRLVVCIDEVVGFLVKIVSIEKVVVFAGVVVVHPPNLWLIKKVLAEWTSQSTCQERAN